MSTRATYQINESCFYIHHDGYPTGAATYFQGMQQWKNTDGGLAAQFVRANATAEFTQGREEHADTAYHYVLDDHENLKAYVRDFKQNTWTLFFDGTLTGFLARYFISKKTQPGSNRLID